MSDTLFLIDSKIPKWDDYKIVPEHILKNPAYEKATVVFKGFLLCPSIDAAGTSAVYLNPVYGIPDSGGDGDIIIQNNNAKACPYPPGYTIAK